MLRIHERRNICGRKIREIRKSRELSQENVAAIIQLAGLDLTQKAISRMEAGKRVVTDYELKYLASALGVTTVSYTHLSKPCPACGI